MNEAQRLRYSRHIQLPQIGLSGQQLLLDSSVLIVGLGGLGSPLAMYLASSGIGHMTLCDDDKVELANLQRQIIHSIQTVGMSKVDSAKNRLLSLNPDVTIDVVDYRQDAHTLSEQVRKVSVVVDATDNFTTRFAINKICVKENIPLVTGAAIRFQGQVAVFHNHLEDSPCYRCLYDDETGIMQQESCDQSGIFAPVAGLVGTMLAVETLKLLLAIGSNMCGKLLLFDACGQGWRETILSKDPKCPVCVCSDVVITPEPVNIRYA